DPQTAEIVSEPFVVCNAPPTATINAALQPDRTIKVSGLARQKLLTLSAAQYRVDNGEWLAIAPEDGLFDSGLERSAFQTAAPLAPGAHTVEVKVFNAAGLSATEKATVTVP